MIVRHLVDTVLAQPCPPNQICQEKPKLPAFNYPLIAACAIVALVLISAWKHLPKGVLVFGALMLGAIFYYLVR